MDIHEFLQPPRTRMDARSRPCREHDYVTHDQRTGNARELDFDELDARERAIFLRCGFHAPQAA